MVRQSFLFPLEAHAREVIAWRAIAGISGSDIGGMMFEAVEVRFGGLWMPHPVEWLSDNAVGEARIFAALSNLAPCSTAVCGDGMSEAFVCTLKRDCLRVTIDPQRRPLNGATPDSDARAPVMSRGALRAQY